MAWGKAGSTTLTGAGDTITVSGITASKFNQTLSHVIQTTSNIRMATRVGNGSIDTGSNYANRSSENGTSEATATSQTYHKNSGSVSSDMFTINYAFNIATKEKLFISHNVVRSTAGAGTAPQRMESVGKWANTSDQFNYIETVNDQAGDYTTDSNLTVIGSDLTPAAAVPALDNVQDNSLFVEKENARRYWFTAQTGDIPTFEDDFDYATQSLADASWVSLDTAVNRVNITNKNLDVVLKTNNSDDTMAHDLGSSLSDSAWVCRFKWNITGLTRNNTSAWHGWIGLSSTNQTGEFDDSQDSMGLAILTQNTGGNTMFWYASGSSAGAVNEQNSQFDDDVPTGTYYIEMIRNADVITVNVYTDSNYTTLLDGGSNTITGTVTGLQYFKVANKTANYSGTITSTIDDLKIYNGLTSVTLLTPATWTKQLKTPTNEDLEDQTWTKSTSDLTQGDSYIQWANMTGGTENGYYDLGSGNISDTKWVLRAKLIVSSYSTGGAAQSRWCGFGLSSSSSTFTGTQDSINIILRTNSSSDTIAATRSNGTDVGGQLGTAGISGVTLGNGTFYLELIRESDSDYKLYVRSGSHTGTLLGTGEYTNASGVSGLRYIKTDRLYQSSASGDFVVKWEDIDFWNEVTEA